MVGHKTESVVFWNGQRLATVLLQRAQKRSFIYRDGQNRCIGFVKTSMTRKQNVWLVEGR